MLNWVIHSLQWIEVAMPFGVRTHHGKGKRDKNSEAVNADMSSRGRSDACMHPCRVKKFNGMVVSARTA